MGSILGINVPFDVNMGGGVANVISGLSKGFNFFFIVVAIILVLFGIGTPIYLHFYNKKKYFIKIPFYKENSIGEPVRRPDLDDVAMRYKVSTTGDNLIYWKKTKKFKFFPKHESSKDTYPYCELRDGEIINFKLGSIDKVREEAGIKLTPSNLRAERASTASLLEEHFKKKDLWQQWQNTIVAIVLIAIILVGGWFIAKKIDSSMGSLATTTKNLALVTENQAKTEALIVTALQSTKTSGLVPVT